MAHMEPEYWNGHFSRVRECGEERMVPEMYVESDAEVLETVFGYGVRLSASGYLDCTEWEVFDTEAEAEARGEAMMEDD
jgi:hypothetical protein